MIDNQNDLRNFIATSSGKEGIEWEVNGDRLWFRKTKAETKEIPSGKMISLVLDYATELYQNL